MVDHIRHYAIILFFILTLSACAERDLTYEEFLEKHIEAMGGKEAIEAVENIDIELEISEPPSSSLEFAAGNTLKAH
jgi:hypothetical protein